MSEARIPVNPISDALSSLEGMRAVNRELRTAPVQQDVPPLTDEDMIEQFRRDTGLIINTNGEVIGQDPNWVDPQGQPRPAIEGAPVTQPAPQEEEKVFGFRKKTALDSGARVSLQKIRGIDLEAGEVIIDGMRFPLDAAEIQNVAHFCLNAMHRDLQKQINELASLYEVPGANVPSLQQGTPGQPVPPAASAVPVVRGDVQGEAPADNADGQGGTVS